jgi:hypothetical protein
LFAAVEVVVAEIFLPSLLRYVISPVVLVQGTSVRRAVFQLNLKRIFDVVFVAKYAVFKRRLITLEHRTLPILFFDQALEILQLRIFERVGFLAVDRCQEKEDDCAKFH